MAAGSRVLVTIYVIEVDFRGFVVGISVGGAVHLGLTLTVEDANEDPGTGV